MTSRSMHAAGRNRCGRDAPRGWRRIHVAGPGSTVHSHLFRADPLVTRHVLAEVAALITPAMGPDLAARAELVLAEMINNVAQHGVPTGPDGDRAPAGQDRRTAIRLCIALAPHGPVCILADRGQAIPRACIEAPPAPVPASLPESGFGWGLIRQLTDQLCYARDGGRNILFFRIPA